MNVLVPRAYSERERERERQTDRQTDRVSTLLNWRIQKEIQREDLKTYLYPSNKLLSKSAERRNYSAENTECFAARLENFLLAEEAQKGNKYLKRKRKRTFEL